MNKKNPKQDDSDSRKKLIGDDHPYPMTAPGIISDRNGSGTVVRYLGVLERPMTVYSDRSKEEITGILHRKMPTPEMLDMMYKVFSLLDPRNQRRAIMVKGQPGAGKTFLGELAGEVSSQKGAIKVDCTGLNLMELFYETVLDFKGNQRFYDQLDEKIRKYNESASILFLRSSVLHPRSVDILRDALGEAFSEDRDGKIAIDWSRANRSHKDAQGDYLPSRECSEIVAKGLQEVADKEGMNSGSGNVLGMATQRGPAWRAYKEGRILLLDEVNRAKKGTFGVVHGFMQMAIGEEQRCTVNNPLKEKGDRVSENIVFERSEMGAGFLVYMTGNTEDDSDEVLELPEALSSRIVQLQVPKLTARDWQHRFCQMLTGMPVSTEYEAQRDVWERDPAQFKKFLIDMRTKHESREVPDHQMALLRRKWRDVIEASERFARFMEGTAKAVNPNSDSYRTASDLTQLLDEINEVFKREASIDLRKITFFLNEAFLDKPVVRPPQSGPEITPLLSAEDMPDKPGEIQQNLGTHLSYAIMDWIISTTYARGKDKLGKRLMELAGECGIVPPHMQEAMASDKKSFADLLNDNPYTSDDADLRAEVTRDILCDYLRRSNAGLTAANDDIVTPGAVRMAIEDIDGEDVDDSAAAEAVIFSDDPDAAALNKVMTIDSAAQAISKKILPPAPPPQELVARTALLYALAAPAVRDMNMDVLWAKSFSLAAGLVPEGAGLAVKDQALAMAEGSADSGIAVTTLMTEDKGAESPLHIVWNSKNHRMLVVGDGAAPEGLARAFNKAGSAYVDRNEQDAQKKIDKALSHVMGKGRAANENTLKNAFLMRVSAATAQDEAVAFDTLLAKKDSTVRLPVYVTGRPAPEGPQ